MKVLIEDRARQGNTPATAIEHPWDETTRSRFNRFDIEDLEDGDVVNKDDAAFYLEIIDEEGN